MEFLESVKHRLRKYKSHQITFLEPHFTYRILQRGGNKKDVVDLLLHPDKLVRCELQLGDSGDMKHILYFDIGKFTIVLPIFFDIHGKQCLYIITYIKRWRT